MSETSAIVTPAIEAINATGLAYVFRCQSGLVRVRRGWMHLAPEGTPDIVGWLLDGTARFIGIEAKVKGKKPTPAQEETRLQLLAAGCVAGVIYSAADGVALVRDAARRAA